MRLQLVITASALLDLLKIAESLVEPELGFLSYHRQLVSNAVFELENDRRHSSRSED
jgi:hypothetical protein